MSVCVSVSVSVVGCDARCALLFPHYGRALGAHVGGRDSSIITGERRHGPLPTHLLSSTARPFMDTCSAAAARLRLSTEVACLHWDGVFGGC